MLARKTMPTRPRRHRQQRHRKLRHNSRRSSRLNVPKRIRQKRMDNTNLLARKAARMIAEFSDADAPCEWLFLVQLQASDQLPSRVRPVGWPQTTTRDNGERRACCRMLLASCTVPSSAFVEVGVGTALAWSKRRSCKMRHRLRSPALKRQLTMAGNKLHKKPYFSVDVMYCFQ